MTEWTADPDHVKYVPPTVDYQNEADFDRQVQQAAQGQPAPAPQREDIPPLVARKRSEYAAGSGAEADPYRHTGRTPEVLVFTGRFDAATLAIMIQATEKWKLSGLHLHVTPRVKSDIVFGADWKPWLLQKEENRVLETTAMGVPVHVVEGYGRTVRLTTQEWNLTLIAHGASSLAGEG